MKLYQLYMEKNIHKIFNIHYLLYNTLVCLQLSRGIFALVTPVVGVSYETLISYSNTFHLPFLYAGSPLAKQTQANVKNKQQQLTKRHNPPFSNHKSSNQINSDLIADYGLYMQVSVR